MLKNLRCDAQSPVTHWHIFYSECISEPRHKHEKIEPGSYHANNAASQLSVEITSRGHFSHYHLQCSHASSGAGAEEDGEQNRAQRFEVRSLGSSKTNGSRSRRSDMRSVNIAFPSYVWKFCIKRRLQKRDKNKECPHVPAGGQTEVLLIALHQTMVLRRCHQPAHAQTWAREQVRDSLPPHQSEIQPPAVSSRSSPQRMQVLAVAS